MKTILVALVVLPVAAYADPNVRSMSLEDALSTQVEGASRFRQPLSEAPSSVTVISASDIHDFGYRNLAEALQSVPGVYATNDSAYTYLGVRGLGRPGDYNSRILLLADGLKRNDPIYNQAMVGNESPIDIDWVKQIEFVPGAASALYGGNALFGIANAVLWSGADLNGSRVTAEAGSDGMAHLGFLTGNRVEGGADWVAGLSVYQSRGENPHFSEFDIAGISDGVARGLDGERYIKAFAKLTSGDWNLDASFSSRRKNVPTAYYGTTFDVPGDFTDDDFAFVDISQKRDITPDWNQYLRLSLGAYHYDAQYVFPGLVNRDNASARWMNAEYRLAYTGRPNHRLMFGVETEIAPRLDQGNYDVSPTVVHLADHRDNRSIGLFVQDEWQLSSKWVTDMGARLDRLKDDDSIVSPRLALIYHPDPESSLKLIHGRAFREPNAYERFYNDGNLSQKANPGLMPERIISTELTAEVPLSSTMHMGGTLYRYRLDHLIDQVTDPNDGLAVFINNSQLHAHGLELEAETIIPIGLTVKGSMAWQVVEQANGNAVNSPRQLAKLLVNGPLFSTGFRLGLDLQGIGPRNTLGGTSVPGYLTGNLTLTQKLTAIRGEWSLGIYNLAGKHYLDPAPPLMLQDSLPSNGRQILLRVMAGF